MAWASTSTVAVAWISAVSSAATTTDPAATVRRPLGAVTEARVTTLTRFLAIAIPIASPSDFMTIKTTAEAWFVTVALTMAAFTAATVTSPAAEMSLSVTSAATWADCWAPKAEAISGSPRIVSTRLNRMFCERQPMELNASVTPPLLVAEATAALVMASSWAT